MNATIFLKNKNFQVVENLKYISYTKNDQIINITNFAEFKLLHPYNIDFTFVGDTIDSFNSNTIEFVHFANK